MSPDVHFSLNPVGGYGLIIVLVAVLLALLALGPARDKITARRRRILVGLRITVILLTLLGLLRPTLVHTTTLKQPATIVVLADRSRSMQVDDAAGKKTRWEMLRTTLDEAAPKLDALKQEVDVQMFAFDARLHPLIFEDGVIDLGEKPVGSETAMGAVLEGLLQREADRRIAGIILLGDGAQRAIAPLDLPPQVPVRRMADLGYPLYTVPFGQGRAQGQARDVAVETFLVPSTVYVKNPLSTSGTVRIDGFVNRTMPAQLLFETSPGVMTPVAAVPIQAKSDAERVPVELEYTPEIPGEFKVTLRVPEQSGELVTTNNEMSTFVTVLKGGLNVLYLEGVARVESKFLRRALDASPDIKVDFLRIDARKPETKPADLSERFDPGKYDVYILGDLDSSTLTPDELAKLSTAVQHGAGFIMLGGFHSFGPGGYGRTALADVLPITIDRLERQNFDEPLRADLHLSEHPRMRPTPIGNTQSLMQLAPPSRNASAWAELPPLEGANRFRGIKPGAQVLAESERSQPLLVAKDFGAGRVIAFAIDSTWHWWMTGHEAAHKRFWRQTVLWLARKEASSEGSVTLALDQRRYAPGARVDFTVAAHNAHGEPILDATFKVEVQGPAGPPVAVHVRRQPSNSAGTFAETQPPGDYMIRVTGTHGDDLIGAAQARFLVFNQDLELDNPAADRALLESLAAMTGGHSVAPEQLPSLLDELGKATDRLRVEVQSKTTLWDTWPFFGLFVGLLGVEWYLRKKWGLV
ncbi:MAG TPA: glutamine amidotransferase [Pirellulales bacterium]|nr:glutamine amidotransferase [Pirellulales bacterium]